MEDNELKKCPFCGYEVIDVRSKKSSRSGGVEWTVRCPSCISYGPRSSARDEAIKLWNKRSGPITCSDYYIAQ